MTMLSRHLLLALALLLAAPGAWAEQCTLSSGYEAMTTVAEAGIWSGCTASTNDDFTLSGSAELVIDGLLAFNTGTTTFTCDSGATLRITPGSGFDATGATSVKLVIKDGCNFQPQGQVVWKGRVGSTTTHAAGPPATGTITVSGSGSPTAAGSASTDLVYFPYPNESDTPGKTIRTPVQSTTGLPEAGYFKPTGMAGAFASISSLSATEIVFRTNAYVSEAGGTDGGAEDPYTGARGPAQSSATAATVTRTRGGFLTKVQLDHATTTDGDFTDQAVRFTTGTCAGRNPYPIIYTDANTSPTEDDIYVLGDASDCSGGDVIIEQAPLVGDPVWIVRPVIFEGGGVMNVIIHGATIAGEWIDFRNLAAKQHGTLSHPSFGNVMFIKQAAAGANPTGHLRHVRMAYSRVASTGAATGAILAVNSNSGLTAYTNGAGETFDLSGLDLSAWHILDQFNVSVGVEGVHCILAYSIAGLNADRFRCERMGDDGIAWVGGSFGANATQTLRLREWQVMAANNDASGGSFSQQCIDLSGGSSGNTDILHASVIIEDSFLRGCDDGIVTWTVLNSVIRRSILGGDAAAGATLTGSLTGYSSLSASAIEANPNRIENSLIFQLDGVSGSNGLMPKGGIYDSIVAGNLIGSPGNGSILKDATEVERSIIDYANDSNFSAMFDRSGTQTMVAVETLPVTDTVFLNTSGGAKSLFTTNFATAPITTFTLNRVYIGVEAINAANGFLTQGDTVLTNAQDWIVATGTPSAGGMRGLGGTGNGATVSETCFETTLANAITNAANFGSSRTATSIEVDDIRPDAGSDVPLIAFVDGAPSVCERPRAIGLSQIGFAHAMAGPGLTLWPETFTTSETLLRQIGSGRGGSALLPPGLIP